jgi:hypothetical protein
MGRLRNLIAGVAALFGTCAASPSVYAQQHALVQLVGITYPAMTKLQFGWLDGGSRIERAYCATEFWYSKTRGQDSIFADVIWRVVDVERAPDSAATEDGLYFSCDAGKIPIHTHPPDCETTPSGKLVNCVPNCQPTTLDYEAVEFFKAPLGVIQCGINSFVPFSWRDHLKGVR